MPCSINASLTKYNQKLTPSQQYKLSTCGHSSLYGLDRWEHGGLRSFFAITCGLAVCSRCAKRATKQRQAAIERNLPRVFNANPHDYYFALTLYAPHNTEPSMARWHFDKLNNKFQRMRETKRYIELNESGYFRTLEIKKTGADAVYPHSHTLLAFENNGGAGFDLAALRERLDHYYGSDGYFLKPIETTNKHSTLLDAVVGFAMYISKGLAGVIDSFRAVYDDFFMTAASLMRGARKYVSTGIFKGLLAPDEAPKSEYKDGDPIFKVCRKTKMIEVAAYNSERGFLGSFRVAADQRLKQLKERGSGAIQAAIDDLSAHLSNTCFDVDAVGRALLKAPPPAVVAPYDRSAHVAPPVMPDGYLVERRGAFTTYLPDEWGRFVTDDDYYYIPPTKPQESQQVAAVISDDRYSKPKPMNRVAAALEAFEALLESGMNRP